MSRKSMAKGPDPHPQLRTFIAVKFPLTAELRDVCVELESMGRPIKPIAQDGIHVTLKFLGDTKQADVPAIGQTIHDVAAGKAAFEAELMGLGAFPNVRRPSVVWAGLAGAEMLSTIASELSKRLQRLGYEAEKRPFRPHLTLARVRNQPPPPELSELIEAFASTTFGSVRIETLVFFQSELRRDGPQYTVLSTSDLSS